MQKSISPSKQQIQEELREAMDLNNLYHSPEFQRHLLPRLQQDTQQQWLDPTKFKDQLEFQRAYDQAFAKAMVAASLIRFLSTQAERIKTLQEAIDTPEKNYQI